MMANSDDIAKVAFPDIEPEADRAARHKQAIFHALQVVAAACEEARKDGFYAEFGVPLDQWGRYFATPVSLIKRF